MTVDIVLYSLVAGLATTLGGVLVLGLGRPGPRSLAPLLGGAAGIMFSVVVFDLLPSSLAYGDGRAAIAGSAAGIALLCGLDVFFSRRFAARTTQEKGARFLKMGYMIAVGIALHDLPEGIAIAAGYAATERLGLLLAVAIGLHNIPEGMATAAPLVLAGIPPAVVLLINLGVSLFTPIGTILGLILVHISPGLIATLLAGAAGAMTYISVGELIPETRRQDPLRGGIGLVAGFLLMRWINRWH